MDFYCEGMGLRPLSRALGVSRDTFKAKIKILADESYEEFYLNDDFKYQEQFHPLTKDQKKLGNKPNTKTPLIVFNEMETHEHTYLKPISIGIAYDFHNKKIITVRCAVIRAGISTMKRTTFTHVKSMDSLQESLLVFMKHHNNKRR